MKVFCRDCKFYKKHTDILYYTEYIDDAIRPDNRIKKRCYPSGTNSHNDCPHYSPRLLKRVKDFIQRLWPQNTTPPVTESNIEEVCGSGNESLSNYTVSSVDIEAQGHMSKEEQDKFYGIVRSMGKRYRIVKVREESPAVETPPVVEAPQEEDLYDLAICDWCGDIMQRGSKFCSDQCAEEWDADLKNTEENPVNNLLKDLGYVEVEKTDLTEAITRRVLYFGHENKPINIRM